ncbi:MAG: choice-of-anchor J domain-containing protein [Candidatus Hydrothermales bacterium]
MKKLFFLSFLNSFLFGIAILNENFEGTWSTINPPPGWTIIYSSPPDNNDWHKFFYSEVNSNVARVYYSPVEYQNDWLITPSLDFSNARACSLYFWHYYDDYGGDLTDTGFVLLSTNGGNSWPYKIAIFLSDILGRDTFFDLSSYIGNSNVKIAFRYKGNDDWYWYVDNVRVTKQLQYYNDVGIKSITINPSNVIIGSPITISVTVKNYGSNGQVNVPVRCKIKRETDGSIVLNNVVYIFNLPPGAESTKVWTYTPVSGGEYSVIDTTELSGDEYPANNKKTAKFAAIPVVVPDWSDNFDSPGNPGGWTHSGAFDEWELGTPTRGPKNSYSSPNCWATDLDNTYENNSDNYLFSPYINLTSFGPEDSVFVSLYHYDSLETNYDYVYLQASRDGINWTNLYAFNGHTTTWINDKFLIPQTLYGDTIRIRFNLRADGSVTYAGFHLDNFEVFFILKAPFIYPLSYDQDGNYTVYWRKVRGADRYALWEISDETLLFFDEGNNFNNWNTNFFIVTKEAAFSEGSSFWSGEHTYNYSSYISTKNNYQIGIGGGFCEFFAMYNLSPNDKIIFEVSNDNGVSWKTLWEQTGGNSSWRKIRVSLNDYMGNLLKFRFRFIGDATDSRGFYFDDFKVVSFNKRTLISNTVVDTFYNITGKSVGTYYYVVKAIRNSPYKESKESNIEDIVVKSTNSSPSITVTFPNSNINADGFVWIKWDDNDIDDNATISLFYDNNSAGYDGILITLGISEDSPSDSFRWDVRGISAGNYYVYAIITDPFTSTRSNYSARIRVQTLTPPNQQNPSGTDTVYNEWVRIIAQDNVSDGSIAHFSNIKGDTNINSDNEINILFGPSFIPWSSDAVIRIDGQNFIYAKPGEGIRERALRRLIGNQGIPTTQPNNPVMNDNSVGLTQTWWYNGVSVRQDLIFAYGAYSYGPSWGVSKQHYDQILTRYTFKNKSLSPKWVGLRIEWDIEIDVYDGAIIKPNLENSFLTKERFYSPNFNKNFLCQDSLPGHETPLARTMGYINEWGVATNPDALAVIHWFHPNAYPGYSYSVDPTKDIGNDSAVLLWFYPVLVNPGDSVIFSTYYGSVRYDVRALGEEESYLTLHTERNYVILKWKISSGENYEIFRKRGNEEFKKIASLPKGINNYKDGPLSEGEYSYKIDIMEGEKVIKILGPFKIYVKGLKLWVGKPIPNPFENNFYLPIEIPNEGDLMIEIFDSSGRKIFNRRYTFKYGGVYKIQFDEESFKFHKGIYYLKVIFGEKEILRKLIKVK